MLRGAAHTLADSKLEAVLMELNGSGEAYGFDEQAIHRSMLALGFEQCSYNALTRELQTNSDVIWYTGNILYVRNPMSAQVLVSSAQRYAVICMQL